MQWKYENQENKLENHANPLHTFRKWSITWSLEFHLYQKYILVNINSNRLIKLFFVVFKTSVQ